MIEAGSEALAFELRDQFGRKIRLSDFKERRHLLLCSYPADWTPT